MPFRYTGKVLLAMAMLLTGSFLPGQAQNETRNPNGAAPAGQAPAPPQGAATVDTASRKQAYLRYMEAHQLLGTRPPKIAEAVTAFKDAIRLDPAAAEPHADLGELYLFYMQRLDDAEKEGLLAVRLDKDCFGGHKLLARIYLVATRMEKEPRPVLTERAMREYEQVARLDPANAEAWAILASIYQARKEETKYIEALEKWAAAGVPEEPFFYSRVMGQELTPGLALFQLSGHYLKLGKYPTAIESARRAFETDPESEEYTQRLIETLRCANGITEELRQYAQISRIAEVPLLQVGYGQALIRAGQYPQAMEKLRASLAAAPNDPRTIEYLALAQRRAGQLPQAAETLKQGIATVGGSARFRLRLDLAKTLDDGSRHAEAVTQYENALDELLAAEQNIPMREMLLADALSQLSRIYARQNGNEKIQALYQRARKSLGENSALLDTISIENMQDEGRLREALELTRTAARRRPEDKSFRLTEARLLSETGMHQESARLLVEMLTDRPEEAAQDANVHALLSGVQARSRDFAEAENSIRRAMALTPRDGELLLQLSLVQDKAGKREDSEKTLRQLLEQEPEHAAALNSLGRYLLEREKNYEEAVRLIERAVNLEPVNGNYLDSLGLAQYKLGRLEQARIQLEKARQYARRNASVHEHLGDVLKDLGRIAEARTHWETAIRLSVEMTESNRLREKLKGAGKPAPAKSGRRN
ncbi:MAG: tetratricopeptide repeat protein [Blastocatellia bacterium]